MQGKSGSVRKQCSLRSYLQRALAVSMAEPARLEEAWRRLANCATCGFLGFSLTVMKPLSECRLYGFVDTAYLHGRAPELIAQRLCEGGVDILQLRAKLSTPDELRRMAEAIVPITREANVRFVVNDSVEVAIQCEAQYCHLGQEDFFGAGHRNVSELLPAGSRLKVGLSSHAAEQALQAIAAGAAYLGVGPVYATGTKPGVRPVTLEYVRWAAANVHIPWFAIGGINLGNVDDVVGAGARGICVVSALLNSEDVAATCREFRKRLG
jgi:thiamine-phosphate pyrophosphorylase